MTTEQIGKPANFNYTANSPPRDTTKDLIIMLSIMLEEDEKKRTDGALHIAKWFAKPLEEVIKLNEALSGVENYASLGRFNFNGAPR